jgi:hypothetical protein
MKTEPFIIKDKTNYIRVIDDAYSICGLDKASVFPAGQLKTVRGHIEKLHSLGFDDVLVKKLIITEEDL